MTDEQMDARLAAAGERWRTDNTTVACAPAPTVAETDPEIAPPAPAHRRRWGLLGSAAAVAAALVVGGTFLLRGSGNGPTPSGDTAALEGHVWQVEGRDIRPRRSTSIATATSSRTTSAVSSAAPQRSTAAR